MPLAEVGKDVGELRRGAIGKELLESLVIDLEFAAAMDEPDKLSLAGSQRTGIRRAHFKERVAG